VNTPRGFCGSGHRHGRAAIYHVHSFIAFAHFYLRQRLIPPERRLLADACVTPRGPLRAATSRSSIGTINVPQAGRRAIIGLTIIPFKEFVAKDATLTPKII